MAQDPGLGTKRICPACSAKYYDLARSIAHCPKCEHEHDFALNPISRNPTSLSAKLSRKTEKKLNGSAGAHLKELNALNKDADEIPELDEEEDARDLEGQSDIPHKIHDLSEEDDADDEKIIEAVEKDELEVLERVAEEA